MGLRMTRARSEGTRSSGRVSGADDGDSNAVQQILAGRSGKSNGSGGVGCEYFVGAVNDRALEVSEAVGGGKSRRI